MFGLRVTPTLFLSTPSARRATSCANRKRPTSADFYPRPPRGGRPELLPGVRPPVEISIHALREEGDLPVPSDSRFHRISIHALREEGDRPQNLRCSLQAISIHALREEGDPRNLIVRAPLVQISIHALREEGDAFFLAIAVPPFLISIHALREEGDFRPCRDRACAGAISIHALREEGDPRSCSASPRPWNFYPRPPRGGRRVEAVRDMLDGVFLSTPSARRATSGRLQLVSNSVYFYPRPPRGGRPVAVPVRYSSFLNFYPRPPRGGRPLPVFPQNAVRSISIHALREEGDGFA